jgi:hypothetical protein
MATVSMNTEDYIRNQQDGYRRDAIRLAEYRRREEEKRVVDQSKTIGQ